jgi:aspartate/methionine/tyrosine aminotransferase
MSTPLSPCILRTAEPPIPAVRAWIGAYGGDFGPPIDLTQAVPGYPPHPELLARLAAAAGAAWSADYGAIEGDDALRAALAEDVSATYDTTVTAAEVAITAGCNLAFVMASTVLAGPGEALLLPAPWYFNHAMALQMRGVETRALPCLAADGFVPDPDRAAALIDARVRAIVLITPNNPTGAIYPPEVIARFAALCREHRLWLLIDETYRDFRPAGGPPHPLFGAPDWRDFLVHLYSFSKAYCVPGHRMGAVVAGGGFQAQLAKVLDTLQICPSRAPQAALAWAIAGLRRWREENRGVMATRAAAFRRALAPLPEWRIEAIGGYFAYLRLPAWAPPAEETARILASRLGLATLPGSFFGPGQDRHLRIAFANADLPVIAEVPARIAAFNV